MGIIPESQTLSPGPVIGESLGLRIILFTFVGSMKSGQRLLMTMHDIVHFIKASERVSTSCALSIFNLVNTFWIQITHMNNSLFSPP